jgi:amino acid permease
MGMIRKTLKENKGVALITVLGVFIIIMIFSLSISTIFASNLKQATQQER